MTDLITYIRVSTSQQGRSGLGIEAQRQALVHFAQSEGFTVAREFVAHCGLSGRYVTARAPMTIRAARVATNGPRMAAQGTACLPAALTIGSV